MCKITMKRRLEFYTSFEYDKQPIFKEGDIVWLYQEPLGIGTGIWLMYEAKIRKSLGSLQLQFDRVPCLGTYMPMYEVELPWSIDPDVSSKDSKVVGRSVTRQSCEIHLFDPKTILLDEILCSVGENNVNILSGLSEVEKRQIPKDGLVFLGRSQLAEVRKQLASTGHNEHTDCDMNSDSKEFQMYVSLLIES